MSKTEDMNSKIDAALEKNQNFFDIEHMFYHLCYA